MTRGDTGTTGERTGRGASAARTGVLGALTAAAPLSIDTYLPALPTVAVDLGTSPALVALTLSACVVGLAVGQLVAGPLSDVLGRRRPLVVGIVGFTLFSAACAAAPDVATLVALRLGQGLFGAVGIVLARAVVRDLYAGPAAARAFAALMLVSGVAPIVAPVLGGQLLRVTSWRGVFVALAALGILVTIGVLAAVPETLPPGTRQGGGLRTTITSFRILLADRRVLACVLAAGFAFSAMFAYISGATFVLQDLYGLSPQGFSGVFAVNSVGIVASAQVSGRTVAAEKVQPARMLAAGLAVATAGCLVVLLDGLFSLGVVVLVAGLFVTVCGVGLSLPTATTLALADHPERAGSASALLGTAQFLVGGLAAPLVGLGGGRSALPMGIVMLAGTSAALVAFTVLWRRAARPGPADRGAAPGGQLGSGT